MDNNNRAQVVLETVLGRRSVPQVREERPPQESIDAMLAAAVSAPNHYRTSPWRFAVVAGQERERLGDVFAEAACAHARTMGQPLPDASMLDRERRKPLRAPVIIAVACDLGVSSKAKRVEEIAAVAAAVENMLIVAHALGLGCMWRTGPPADAAEVKRFLDFEETWQIVAFVYVGYATELALPERQPGRAIPVTWKGWTESDPKAPDESPSVEGP